MDKSRAAVFHLIASLAAASGPWHEAHRLACEKQELCNGILCADVCTPGTVQTDAWLQWALAYQRKLQMPQSFSKAQLPGTHNSAISEAYGYGIEKYMVAALLREDPAELNDHDDLGEGVCQHLSVLDQLKMGMRHIELDVWWTPVTRNDTVTATAAAEAGGGGGGDMLVCHSPVPLLPRRTIRAVEDAAAEKGLELAWQKDKLSCVGTSRTLRDALLEVKGWLEEDGTDEDEVVVLFMDTKWLPSATAADAANTIIMEVLGDLVWTPADGANPLNATLDGFRYGEGGRGARRVLMEGNGQGWSKGEATPQQVFYPTFWAYQFDAETSLGEFPDCSFNGDRSWWGKQWVRALLNDNPGPVATEGMARCGVQLTAGNYVNPDEMASFVWSWATGEPTTTASEITGKGKGKGGGEEALAVAVAPSSHWTSFDAAAALPVACAPDISSVDGASSSSSSSDGDWAVSASAFPFAAYAKADCPAGYSPAPHPPLNGYSNTMLWLAASARRIWINASMEF